MPLNEKKIIQILLEESKKLDERCPGYREEIIEVISEVITYERQHRVNGTNIKQKVADKCSAAGQFLA
jgi:hypothetical protein